VVWSVDRAVARRLNGEGCVGRNEELSVGCGDFDERRGCGVGCAHGMILSLRREKGRVNDVVG
jgi:hypothetical protein